MITAILLGLGTLAVIGCTMVLRHRPVSVKHYLPRVWPGQQILRSYREDVAEVERLTGITNELRGWPPEDVQ